MSIRTAGIIDAEIDAIKVNNNPNSHTGNASRNNVPNKTLLVGTFVCAVLGTLRSRLPF